MMTTSEKVFKCLKKLQDPNSDFMLGDLFDIFSTIGLQRRDWELFKSVIHRYIYDNNVVTMGAFPDAIGELYVIKIDEHKTVANCKVELISVAGCVVRAWDLKVRIN